MRTFLIVCALAFLAGCASQNYKHAEKPFDSPAQNGWRVGDLFRH